MLQSSAIPSSSAMSLFDYFDSAAASPSPTAFHMMAAIPQVANTANAFAGDERCAVCGDGAHGVHFGVQVCRACAAFFRRSTIARRVYRCRYDGNCAIDQPEVRCACRACRFAKCLALGMDPAAVQRNRDQIGPRRYKATAANPERRTDGGEMWRHNSSSPPQQNFMPMPITSSNFLLPPLFTADADVQLHGVAKWEHFEDDESMTSSTTTREVHVEDGKLYALLGKVPPPSVAPAADQLFLLRRALPSAFSAPPQTQQRQPPQQQQQQPQTTHIGGGGDSGNASASSSVFASPQQHSPPIGVGGGPSCSSAATTHQQQSPAAAAPFIVDNGIPLISEMLRGYRRFKTLRLSAHYLTGNLSQNQLQQTLTLLGDCEEKDLVLANYADNVNILRTDLSLLSEMVEQSFPPLQGTFSMDSKWALLRNFLCPFFIAERSHLTAQRFPPNDTRFVASPYHYFDLARLDHFFAVEQCKTRPEDIARVFEPTFCKIFFLFSDFRTLRLTDEEFVGLMGLLFWNDQVDGINEEERSLALNTRERLFAELYTVSCRRQAEEVAAATIKTADWSNNSAQRGGTSGGERFCTILNKLHFCQKLSLEIASNFSLVNVSRTFEVDPFLHQFNPQTF